MYANGSFSSLLHGVPFTDTNRYSKDTSKFKTGYLVRISHLVSHYLTENPAQTFTSYQLHFPSLFKLR